MTKRYCDRCGQQIDEGVHIWYVLELHGTDGEFRHKELCEECYEYLCEKDEVPMADRKTDNSSEKPNNCECEPRKEQNFCGKCRYLYRDFKYGLSCYRLMDNEPCKYEERKDEPTISKMEQVDRDINVRSKDEPQIEVCDRPQRDCENCWKELHCRAKDEPQTERSSE